MKTINKAIKTKKEVYWFAIPFFLALRLISKLSSQPMGLNPFFLRKFIVLKPDLLNPKTAILFLENNSRVI